MPHRGAVGQHGGDPAVVPASGAGRQPLRQLLLEHEDRTKDLPARLDQLDHDLGGDIVGQVAEHGQRPAGLAGQLREVERERVHFDDRDILNAGGEQFGPQQRNEVAIPLDRGDAAGGARQRDGQGTQPRSDFQDHLLR